MTAPLKVSCADCAVTEWLPGHVELPDETEQQRLRRHGWRSGRCPTCVFLHNPDGDGIVTTGPKRIQLSRAKGWRKPAGAVVVSRPSKWGNPFKVGEPSPWGEHEPMTAADAVETYRYLIASAGTILRGNDVFGWEADPQVSEAARRELRGRDLACWCPLDQPCHADVLLEVANAPDPPTSPAASVWDRPEGMRI